MRVVEDQSAIARAQSELVNRIQQAAARTGPLKLGFRGGSVEGAAAWISDCDLWFASKSLRNRYWNAFGKGNPFSEAASIIVEVNPPISGIDRAVSGIFIEDDVGAVYLAYRGRVGGGRKGIGKAAFLKWYDGEVREVIDGDKNTEVIVVGALADSDLISAIDRFVSLVQKFKEEIADGGDVEEPKPGTESYDPWDEFVSWARRFYEWDGFDADERDYKLTITEHIKEAREAFERGDDDWPSLLRKAFGPPNNLTFFIAHARFLDWVENNLEDAADALRAIWDTSHAGIDRIETFLDRVPKSALESPGNRIAVASYLLMGDDPFLYPPYKPTAFGKGMALTAFPLPEKGLSEAETYRTALSFLDRFIGEGKSRGLEVRDRLDAQGLLWSIVKTSILEKSMAPLEKERLSRYRGASPAVWWVNQGHHYVEELEGGYVSAPMHNKQGVVLSHWHNVSRLQPEDVIVHYRDGSIRAISRVSRRAAIVKGKDPDPSDLYRAQTDYFELAESIPLTRIPVEWRTEESEHKGPFDRTGAVKQIYLLPLTPEFADRLRLEFADHWPEASPWAAKQTGAWLLQANPKYWNLEENLARMEVGDEDSWYVSRFGREMQEHDPVVLWQSGDRAGVYAIGAISGELFVRETSDWRPGSEDGESTEEAVPYRLTRILDPPIPKAGIIEHSILSGLSVLKGPQGTNFRVTQEQWAALRELIDPSPKPAKAITFDGIKNAISQEGLQISERTLRRYHLAIQMRGFVILSGVSGTGKTWLTEAYAKAIGAEYLLVPVAPNWTTNEDLLGYFNPLDEKYHDTEFSRFLRAAADEYEISTRSSREASAYCLTLDEMNLARVEYYFAKFLSAMEVRARRSAAIELGPGEHVKLPPNLLFVGTVNVDETTHLFADKVFDRAQLIELDVTREQIVSFLGAASYREAVVEIWDAVADTAPFAFRIVDEIRSYVDRAEEMNVEQELALDEQILQKILPKLSGSEVGPALERLVEIARERYPLTAQKASRMLDDVRRYGLASYF